MDSEYGLAIARLRQDGSRKVLRPVQERVNDIQTVIVEMARNAHLHVEGFIPEVEQPQEPKPGVLDESGK